MKSDARIPDLWGYEMAGGKAVRCLGAEAAECGLFRLDADPSDRRVERLAARQGLLADVAPLLGLGKAVEASCPSHHLADSLHVKHFGQDAPATICCLFHASTRNKEPAFVNPTIIRGHTKDSIPSHRREDRGLGSGLEENRTGQCGCFDRYSEAASAIVGRTLELGSDEH